MRPQRDAGQRTGRSGKGPSCADCYFGRNGLCALPDEGPCPTFRLDSGQGLMPPAQPELLALDEAHPPTERRADDAPVTPTGIPVAA